MPATDLKDKLINKIRETDNYSVLEELSNFLELQEPETTYELNEQQKKAVRQGQEQIRNRDSLNDKEADKDIDEWLNK